MDTKTFAIITDIHSNLESLNQALKIIDKILSLRNCKIKVYDKLAIENVKEIHGKKLTYTDSLKY